MDVRDLGSKKIIFFHNGVVTNELLRENNVSANIEDGNLIFIYCRPATSTYTEQREPEVLRIDKLPFRLTGSELDIEIPERKYLQKIIIHNNNTVAALDVYGNVILPDIVHHRNNNIYDPFVDLVVDTILLLVDKNWKYEAFNTALTTFLNSTKRLPIKVNIEYLDLPQAMASIVNSVDTLKKELIRRVETVEEFYHKRMSELQDIVILDMLKKITNILAKGYVLKEKQGTIVFEGYATHIKRGGKLVEAPPKKFKIQVAPLAGESNTLVLKNMGESFHPNIDSDGEACYGVKLEMNVDNIGEALTRLLVINLDSCYPNSAADEAKTLFESHVEDKTSSVAEVWTVQ